MRLLPTRRSREERSTYDKTLSFDAYLDLVQSFQYGGTGYGYLGPGLTVTAPGQKQELIGGEFQSLAGLAYKSDAVVFACMAARMRVFRQARFKYRDLKTKQLFGRDDLRTLETPWPGGTTADLLGRMIQHADLGGNAFVARNTTGLTMLRPDWVTLVLGSNADRGVTAWDVDAEVVGYLYRPGGPGSGTIVPFLPEDVAHFAPVPDPSARFRGMSWLTPLIREVMADKAATDHKLSFFENGATPNLVVKLPVDDLKPFQEWVDAFKEAHEGRGNAYKTMFLAGGADATVVGKDLQQLEFKSTQGAGETRIAAAAGVPPVIVGLSEGLAAATYSNYGQARRHFADTTLRDLWQDACGSLARIIPVQSNAELWYDDTAIPFLQEDQQDAANIRQIDSMTIGTLVKDGFTPESVIAAVLASDWTLLEHTGMYSVQLQPAGKATKTGLLEGIPVPDPAALNGAS